MGATAAAFADWLSKQGRAANTVAAYRRDIATYLRWLAATGQDVADVGGDDLTSYVEHLGTTQRSSSVARALVAIRAFHRWCSAEGVRADDPSSSVGAPSIGQPPPRAVLSERDVRAVVEAVAGKGLEARRDRALLLVLYRAGLKASEAVALDLADVAAGGHQLLVDRGGAHPRTVPLVGDGVRALLAWLHPLGRGRLDAVSDALFLNQRGQRLTRQGLWLLCRSAGERAGLAGLLAPKDLRQACAAGLTRRGLEEERVSALLGHGGGTMPSGEELTSLGWGDE